MHPFPIKVGTFYFCQKFKLWRVNRINEFRSAPDHANLLKKVKIQDMFLKSMNKYSSCLHQDTLGPTHRGRIDIYPTSMSRTVVATFVCFSRAVWNMANMVQLPRALSCEWLQYILLDSDDIFLKFGPNWLGNNCLRTIRSKVWRCRYKLLAKVGKVALYFGQK